MTQSQIRGEAIEFHFCPTCGCVAFWRARQKNEEGRRRIAVNLRLPEPDALAAAPVDHFDGLDASRTSPGTGDASPTIGSSPDVSPGRGNLA